MANLIVAQLLYLDSVDQEKDITMYINSPGGSVTAGSPTAHALLVGCADRGSLQEWRFLTPCDTSAPTSARCASGWPHRWAPSCWHLGSRYLLLWPSCVDSRSLIFSVLLTGQEVQLAKLAHHDPSAAGRSSGSGSRHRDPGQRDPAPQADSERLPGKLQHISDGVVAVAQLFQWIPGITSWELHTC
jgi:hypothetical protein